jgi:predicted DNA-binding transcriptional regulator AlpA
MIKIVKRKPLLQNLGVWADRLTDLIKYEGFPKPIRIGKISGWVESEVDAWIEQQMAEGDAALAGSAA